MSYIAITKGGDYSADDPNTTVQPVELDPNASYSLYADSETEQYQLFQDGVLYATLDGQLFYDGIAADFSDSLAAVALAGGYCADLLIGGAGNDTLDGTGALGGAGDSVYGGGGDDFISGDTSGWADGGSGVNTLGCAVSCVVDLRIGRAASDSGVLFFTNIQNVSASRDADLITGDGGANLIDGYEGFDTLRGGGGDDVIYASNNTVEVRGGRGYDVLYVGNYAPADGALRTLEKIVVYGGGSLDLSAVSAAVAPIRVLTWNEEGAVVTGSQGGDRITGARYADTLTGGEGKDSFVYTALSDSTLAAPDRISDFTRHDRIDLSAIDADAGHDGDQAFVLGGPAGHAGSLVVAYDAARDRTVLDLYVDDDATADARIVLLGNHADLTAAELVL